MPFPRGQRPVFAVQPGEGHCHLLFQPLRYGYDGHYQPERKEAQTHRTADPLSRYACKLYGAATTANARVLGPWKRFAVSKGDKLDMQVYAYYPTASTSSTTTALSVYLNSPSGNTGGTESRNSPSLVAVGLSVYPAPAAASASGVPKAYLKYIFFRVDGTAVGGGQQLVTSAANSIAFEALSLSGTAPEDGYVQVLVANESLAPVWFDDLEVTVQGSMIVQENHYSPWGLNLAGIEKRQDPINDDFQYNSKEKQEELGLNWLDYGWRNYDPQLGRWHGIDGKAEKYISSSPYHYAGNNPVRNYDIDGNEFTPDAQRWIDRLIAEVNRRQAANNQSIAEKQGRLNDGGLSEKQTNRLNRQIDRLQNNNQQLETVRGEVATLAASDQMYHVITTDALNENGPIQGMGVVNATTNFNFANGQVEINISARGGISQFAHELKHAYQFETGNYSVGPALNDPVRGNFLYDRHDEVEAYQREALFGGTSYQINNLPARYAGIANGPVDATTHPNTVPILNLPMNQQRGVFQGIANHTGHAFRINGVSYYRPR